jgi:hypothetical protein
MKEILHIPKLQRKIAGKVIFLLQIKTGLNIIRAHYERGE